MIFNKPARRAQDKAFSLVFFILLVFLLNWALGCAQLKKALEPGEPALQCFEEVYRTVCYETKEGEK